MLVSAAVLAAALVFLQSGGMREYIGVGILDNVGNAFMDAMKGAVSAVRVESKTLDVVSNEISKSVDKLVADNATRIKAAPAEDLQALGASLKSRLTAYFDEAIQSAPPNQITPLNKLKEAAMKAKDQLDAKVSQLRNASQAEKQAAKEFLTADVVKNIKALDNSAVNDLVTKIKSNNPNVAKDGLSFNELNNMQNAFGKTDIGKRQLKSLYQKLGLDDNGLPKGGAKGWVRQNFQNLSKAIAAGVGLVFLGATIYSLINEIKREREKAGNSNTTDTSSDDGEGLSTGAIVAIAAGGIRCLLVVGGLIFAAVAMSSSSTAASASNF